MAERAPRGGHLRGVPAREPVANGPERPPIDPDAEKAVLGACLRSTEAIDAVSEFLIPDHFHDERRQIVYREIHERASVGLPTDLTSIIGSLRDSGKLERVGGPEFVARLAMDAPAVNILVHARNIAEKAHRRWLIATLQHMIALGLGPEGHTDPDYRDRVAMAVTAAATAGARSGSMSMREAMRLGLEQLKLAEERAGRVTGLPTGIVKLDEITGGLHAPEVTLVCAQEKVGKSSLVRAICVNIAKNPLLQTREVPAEDGSMRIEEFLEPQGIALFSNEMPGPEISMLLACSFSHVEYGRVRAGQATPAEIARVNNAAAVLSDLPIRIVGDRSLTVMQMRARLRTIRAEFAREGVRLALFVIDTVQLMGMAEERQPGESEEQVLNRVGRIVGDTATAFGIPCLLVSQLNAEGVTWGSRSLQQHAQAKWKIEVDKPKSHQPIDPREARIIVEFQRNGPEGTADVYFWKRWTRFTESATPELFG